MEPLKILSNAISNNRFSYKEILFVIRIFLGIMSVTMA